MEDNIDSGKTHKYFQWVAKEYAGEGQVKGRPRFVFFGLLAGYSKSDDDVSFHRSPLLPSRLVTSFDEPY